MSVTETVRKEVAKTAPTVKIGKVNLNFLVITRTKLADTLPKVVLESPPQTHDELDTAE